MIISCFLDVRCQFSAVVFCCVLFGLGGESLEHCARVDGERPLQIIKKGQGYPKIHQQSYKMRPFKTIANH